MAITVTVAGCKAPVSVSTVTPKTGAAERNADDDDAPWRGRKALWPGLRDSDDFDVDLLAPYSEVPLARAHEGASPGERTRDRVHRESWHPPDQAAGDDDTAE